MGLSDFKNAIITEDKFSGTFKKFDGAAGFCVGWTSWAASCRAAILLCCSAVPLALLVSLRLARRSGTWRTGRAVVDDQGVIRALCRPWGNRRNYSTR